MSIASEITKLNENLNDSYDVCRDMDADMPEQENFDNLPDTIQSIPRDFYATLVVNTEAGATVEYNGHTQVATSGTVSLNVYREGYATATATLGLLSRTGSVYIYGSETYSLDLYLSSNILAYAPEGTRVTFNGVTKIVDAGGVVDFTVYGTGSYDVVAVKDGITKTNRVQVYDYGQTYSTTFVFNADLNIYTHIGADVILNGLRKTAIDGKVTFKFSSAGTHKVVVIHNGNATVRDITLATIADTDVDIYIVPNAYQQVKYLGVPNTGYINTNFYPTQNTELKIKASHDGSSYSSGDIGQVGTCRWTGNPFWTFGIYPRNLTDSSPVTTFFYGTFYSSGGYTGYTNLQSGVNATDVFEYNLGLTSVSVKNLNTGSVKSATITRNQTFTSTQPLWVGAFNNQGSRLSVKYGTHIYSAIIKESGSVVRHLIPCKRVSDNVLGMYDIINDVFYTNSGTGTFTAGSDVSSNTYCLPSEYTYRKYVASTSAKTQYLNLGEVGTNTSGMLMKVYDELEDITKDCVYVGGRATSNGRFWVGGSYYSDVEAFFSYLGWNTLKRLSTSGSQYSKNISATKTLRTFFMNYLNNRQEGYDDTKAFDINETLVQNTPNLYAFGANNQGSFGISAWIRLYYIILTSGTNVSNIFIPCYRNSDNVIGMYDIVKGNFKTNAGTGTFVISED